MPIRKLEIELDEVIKNKQSIKLDKCPDDHFAGPVVLTVKKDKSVILALDSKKLNKAIHKNKCQKQSVDFLVDAVAVYKSHSRDSRWTFWFSNKDLK